MVAQDPNEIDEKPLDPAVERIRARMVRLLAVSIGIMFAGLMAVLIAIFYKMSNDAGNRLPEQALILPLDAEILGEALGDGHIMLRFKTANGDETLLLRSLSTGEEVARIPVTRQAP